jgi:hypothetical protein
MARKPPLERLARWIIALGIIVIVSAFTYPLIVKGAAESQEEITDGLADRLEFLEGILDDAISPEDSVAIAIEVDQTKDALTRAHRRLDRQRNQYEAIWRWNGRGPMLIVAGLSFLAIGIRLQRFVRYGE